VLSKEEEIARRVKDAAHHLANNVVEAMGPNARAKAAQFLDDMSDSTREPVIAVPTVLIGGRKMIDLLAWARLAHGGTVPITGVTDKKCVKAAAFLALPIVHEERWGKLIYRLVLQACTDKYYYWELARVDHRDSM